MSNFNLFRHIEMHTLKQKHTGISLNAFFSNSVTIALLFSTLYVVQTLTLLMTEDTEKQLSKVGYLN